MQIAKDDETLHTMPTKQVKQAIAVPLKLWASILDHIRHTPCRPQTAIDLLENIEQQCQAVNIND